MNPDLRPGKRFIPITPALPNGIKDILEAASNISKPADARQLGESGIWVLNVCLIICSRLAFEPL